MSAMFNRRDFLKTSAAVAAGLALASCATTPTATTVIPRRKARRPGANDRISVGLVGYGTIAHGTTPNFLRDERLQIVAVADPVTDLPNYSYRAERRGGRLVGQSIVEKHYAEKAKGGYKGCRVYEDFREMFDKEDLDAVVVNTPDHWHCAVAVHAARRGLHVYGQKPLSLTVAEGRRMADEVAANGIVWQTGSQQRSDRDFRTACEYIRNGRLGKLKRILVGIPGGYTNWSQLASRNKPETPPPELNYDLWLGPAPERPYIPALMQLNWRHNFAFSGGMITDWGAHHFDIVQWALGMDGTGPTRVEIHDAVLPKDTEVYNTVPSYNFDFIYAPGASPVPCAKDGVHVNVSEKNRIGVFFEGENGKTMFIERGNLELKPESLRREKIRDGEVRLYESKLHERTFVDCIYSGKQTNTPIEVGHRSITIGHIANIAIRLGRSAVEWDPVKERFVNDTKADAMLSRPMRAKYAV